MADLTQNPRPLATAWSRIDKVALTGVLILLTVAVFDTPAVVPTIEEMLESFWGTLPYILFAVVAIAGMKASGSERLLDGAFQGRETRMILIGALVGGLFALLLVPGDPLRRRPSGRRRAAIGCHGLLAVLAADGPRDVRDHRGRAGLRLRGGQDGGRGHARGGGGLRRSS